MRIRVGFVSNSSSSSFVCDVCGRQESGWDLCLSVAEMAECENGHTFCQSEIKHTDENLDEHVEEEGWGEVPSDYCPVCNMDVVTNEDLAKLYLKENNLTKKEAAEKLKERFGTYKGFMDFCENKEK